MKVVILAGGLGTRLSEITKTIPKPMVLINGKPLIFRIMNYYAKFGFKEFYIALG
jgi:glucose-1-phosphate cytidylyltransferase